MTGSSQSGRKIYPLEQSWVFEIPQALGVKGELKNVLEAFLQHEAIVLYGWRDLHSGLSVSRQRINLFFHRLQKMRKQEDKK